MSIRKLKSSNSTAVYVIAIAVILVAFFLLGGGPWIRGMSYGGGFHAGHSAGIANWNWMTILISLGIGILIGVLFMKRR